MWTNSTNQLPFAPIVITPRIIRQYIKVINCDTCRSVYSGYRRVSGLVANGYSRYDTVCHPETGHCACVDGYKPEGLSCRKCNLLFLFSFVVVCIFSSYFVLACSLQKILLWFICVCAEKQALSRVKYYNYVQTAKTQQETIMTVIITESQC